MASEKVTLLDLSFNTSEGLDGLDALIAKSLELAETKKQLTATLKDEQKQVTDAGKAFKAGAITQDEYKKTVENSTKAQVVITKQINAVNRSITDNNQEIKVNTTLMASQEDSVNALRAQLAKNTKELNAMSAATRNNTDEGKALVTETKEISDKLKEMEKAVGDNRRNVGNYAESIDEALKNTKGLSGATGTLASALSTGTAGVKAFSVALKANPLIAVVSVVLLLVSSIEKLIKRNSEASASLKAAFAPFQVIFTRILDGLTNMLSGVAKAFEWITTKVVGLLDAIGLISEETKKAGQAAADLSKAELAIYEAETKNLVTLSAMSRELANQKTIVGDQLKSAKERNEAAQKGISILKQMEKAEVDVLKQKYEQIKAQNSLSYTSKEDRRAEMQALADLQAKQAEYTEKRKELENQASGLIKSENDKNAAAYKASESAKAQAAIKAATDAENAKRALQQETIKQMEEALTKLNLSIQEKEVTDDGGKKRIKDAELLAKEELDIEKEMLNQGLITQQEYNAREQEINAQRLQVTRDEADRFNAERISSFEAAANKELEIQHYKLQQGLISREEYENAETQLRIEARELRNKMEEEQDALDRERRAMDEANRKELEMANITSQYELRQVQLDAQYAQEIANAERIGADTALIQKKYENAKEANTKARVNAELTMTAGLAGQMSDLLGEESAAGKAFAIVQATINTYLGATKALAQGGILGIAQAAIVTAFGMKQVLTIAKQKDPDTKVNTNVKKYAKGGTIVGKSHAQGGVKFVGDNGQAFEAEGGENVYILKKTASAEINALSDLNVAHGGKSFHTSIPSKFAEGGTVVNMLTPLAPKFKKGDVITSVVDMRKFSNSESNSVNNTSNQSNVKYEKGGKVEKVLANPSISNFDTVNNSFSSSNVKNQKFANGGRVNNYTYRGGNTVKNVSMPTYSSGGSVWESNAYRELNTISNVDIFSTVSNHRNYINTSNLYKFAAGGMAASISEANRLKPQVDNVQLSKESISQLAAVVIEAVSAMPNPIVAVRDIDTAQNEVSVVQSLATY
jgi:hypothetical protein